MRPPQELYDHPVNLFVGGFIGSPAMNLVEATLERTEGGLAVRLGSQRLALGDDVESARPALRGYEGETVIVGLRPEDLEDAALDSAASDDRRLRGKVELREALGAEIIVHFSVDAPPALTDDVRELAEDVGDERIVREEGAQETTMVGRFGPRSTVQPGQTVEVVVDTGTLHFFDPQTGLGIYDR